MTAEGISAVSEKYIEMPSDGLEVFMEIDPKMLESLLFLDDAELQQKLRLIATAIGFDERIAAAQIGDAAKVRTMLKTAGKEDVEKLLRAVGKERAEIILKTLGEDIK